MQDVLAVQDAVFVVFEPLLANGVGLHCATALLTICMRLRCPLRCAIPPSFSLPCCLCLTANRHSTTSIVQQRLSHCQCAAILSLMLWLRAKSRNKYVQPMSQSKSYEQVKHHLRSCRLISVYHWKAGLPEAQAIYTAHKQSLLFLHVASRQTLNHKPPKTFTLVWPQPRLGGAPGEIGAEVWGLWELFVNNVMLNTNSTHCC